MSKSPSFSSANSPRPPAGGGGEACVVASVVPASPPPSPPQPAKRSAARHDSAQIPPSRLVVTTAETVASGLPGDYDLALLDLGLGRLGRDRHHEGSLDRAAVSRDGLRLTVQAGGDLVVHGVGAALHGGHLPDGFD